MKNLDFDDSAVTNFYTNQSKVILEVDDVHLDESLVKVIITVENYSSLQTVNANNNLDLLPITELKMLSGDGNILDFDHDDTSIEVLIIWHEYMPLKLTTRKYRIEGEQVIVDVGKPYPDKR